MIQSDLQSGSSKRLSLHWQILVGMIAGAAIGLLLNLTLSTTHVIVRESIPAQWEKIELQDSTNTVVITAHDKQGGMTAFEIGGKLEADFADLEKFKTAQPGLHGIFSSHGRSWARRVGMLCKRLGGLFLRMLQMVAVPLIVTSLTVGVLGLGKAERLGRMFRRTMLYYICTSLLAIVTGLVMVNTIQPGLRTSLTSSPTPYTPESGSLTEVILVQLETLIPKNPIQALAAGDFLSIISFTIAFAIFALLIGGRTAEAIRNLAQAGLDVMMKMTMAVIALAPLLMLYVTATHGSAIFGSLAWYMLAVFLALVVHACITLPLILKFVAHRNPWEFARAMSPALLTAFSSASSNGTLPLTMASIEQRAGVRTQTSSFVLPLGATINMDGTALYEAVAVLFIAQLHYQEMMPLSAQLVVALTALLASIGAAGIPHAGLVMMVIVLQAVDLPVEKQGIILAVDRILDMCRTSVNVWSDSCGCAVIDSLDD
ncbi:MAG TPA: dicarboxylate/amino acid:cation symporter [Planctomycetaceae bacterium]|nr:dicarboxylate/amino acid:cation symporter [Planctomycetaceae bacterium]